ncbi:MAG: hypothetical protein WCP55_13630 [Lentisphaerota bacterium]
MKAFVPGMKIIFLHGVKDVVESYDLMRHAPGRLEREVFTLSNQYYCEPDSSLKRCADGFMVCLGDGISSTEWAYLQKQWNIGYSFDPVRTGNLTWIFDDATVDRLREDCFVNGTWPGFKQIELLTKDFDLQISCISRAENVHQVSGPVIVPNFDLCAPVSKRKILADDRSRPLVLFGNMTDFEFSPNVLSVSSPITKDYTMGCIILNSTLDAERIIVPCDGNAEFVRTKPPRGFGQCKYMNIPDEFWRKSVELIKRCINTWEEENSIKNCQALNLEDGLRVMSLENSAGILRTALMSCSPTYIKPKCRFNKKLCAVEKITSFPYTPFVIVNDTVVSGHNLSPLHIPPYGIIAMDLQFHKEDL